MALIQITACFPVCVCADILVAYIAFAWLTPIKSNVVVGKCYKSSQTVFVLHHTAGCQYCYCFTVVVTF